MGDLLQLRDAHEQAKMLLPWHVNGTLEPGDAAFFEAHLAECAECRADVVADRALRALYAKTPPAHEPARPAAPNVMGSSAARHVSRSWGKAAAFAMAAAAAVALVVLIVPPQSDGEYRLLGSDEAAQPGNAIVLFAPDTAERELRAALEQAGARLVDGPTASGAYVVRVPEAHRAEALQGLRDLPQVMLAEPIEAAGGP